MRELLDLVLLVSALGLIVLSLLATAANDWDHVSLYLFGLAAVMTAFYMKDAPMSKRYERLCDNCRVQKATHHLHCRTKVGVVSVHQCVECINKTLKALIASDQGLGELDVDLEFSSVE